MRFSRKAHWVILAAVGLAIAAGVGYWRLSPWTPTPDDADRIVAVEVWLDRWYENDEQPVPPRRLARCEDRETIRKLLNAMIPAGDARPHKCGDRGWFLFTRSDGKTAQVYFLPGHTTSEYELRPPGTWVRVPRAEFLAAVKALGVTEFPLDCLKSPEPLR